ncbi:MAG TPA: hypothetical protein VII98_15870 [Solirubrobacteraceae bacterium]
MSRTTTPPDSGTSRHEAAVMQTLGWADEAAADHDYTGALEWLAVIEATGSPLSQEHLGKRATWALVQRDR